MKTMSAAVAAGLLASCATGEKIIPVHTAPLTPGEVATFRTAMGARESFLQLCDYANYTLILAATARNGPSARFLRALPQEPGVSAASAPPPYTGKATFAVSGGGPRYVSETPAKGLRLPDGTPAYDRSYDYSIKLHADEDLVFVTGKGTTTFKKDAAIVLDLHAKQNWQGTSPQLALECSGRDDWTLPAGTIDGSTGMTGALEYSHSFGSGSIGGHFGTILDFTFAGVPARVNLREGSMEHTILWVAGEPYDLAAYPGQLADLAHHRDMYLTALDKGDHVGP